MIFKESIEDIIERVHNEGEAYFTVTSLNGAARYNAIYKEAEREGFEIELVDYGILGGEETYRISNIAD